MGGGEGEGKGGGGEGVSVVRSSGKARLVGYARRVIEVVHWEPVAEQRLRKVPFFIRPWVKRRAEAVARERGLREVSAALLDEIKQREHRPG